MHFNVIMLYFKNALHKKKIHYYYYYNLFYLYFVFVFVATI